MELTVVAASESKPVRRWLELNERRYRGWWVALLECRAEEIGEESIPVIVAHDQATVVRLLSAYDIRGRVVLWHCR